MRYFFNKKKKKTQPDGFVDNIKFIIQVLILVGILRSFIFQPFNIPSSSMIPSLLIGDYIFVTKYAYGYSRFSLPLSLDLFSGRIFGDMPEIGDVAVFRNPQQNHIDFVKRVIGLPGDRIRLEKGRLIINDKMVKRVKQKDFTYLDAQGDQRQATQYIETLPNGIQHAILEERGDNGYFDNFHEVTVPESHIFVMGDNRDNSNDSRSTQIGFIPYDHLVGKATLRFFSIEPPYSAWQIWGWLSSLRPARIGSFIE